MIGVHYGLPGGNAASSAALAQGDDPPPALARHNPTLFGAADQRDRGNTRRVLDFGRKYGATSFGVTLTLAEGTLNAIASGAAMVSGNNTGTLTVSGDPTDVNATLGSIVATVALSGGQPFEIDTLVVTASDNLGATSTIEVPLTVSPAPPPQVLPPPGTFDWAEPGGGAYDIAGNWLPTNGPPGATDTAVFGAGFYTVTGNGSAGQVQVTGALIYAGTLTAVGLGGGIPGVVIDDGGSAGFGGSAGSGGSGGAGGGAALVSEAGVVVGNTGAATLNFTSGAGGTLDTGNSPGAASLVLGASAGASGQLTASDQGTTITSDSDWVIGNAGSGVAQISGGAVASAGTGFASGDFATALGKSAGATGIMQVDGAGSQFDDAGGIYVGVAGTGDLYVTDGATVTSDAPAGDLSAVVGYGTDGATGGDGFVAVLGAGSLWDSEQDTTIGYYATGDVEVINGGTFENDGSLMRIGRIAGSSGTLTLIGNGVLIAPNTTMLLGDAGMGVADLFDNSTGTLDSLVLGAEGGAGTLRPGRQHADGHGRGDGR